MTSRDPSYVTPEIKVKLRRKNRLMRAGRVEEAGALAHQIGRDITRRSKRQLCKLRKYDTKELWTAVRQLTGRAHQPATDQSVTAEALNQHYASVSTDANYERPPPKDSAAERPGWMRYVSDLVFKILDTLRPTATGLDGLQTWFLRLAALFFCGQVTDLINLTLITSTLPAQWKQVGTQDADGTAADGLPADLDNAGAHPHNRARRRAALHLPGTVVTATRSAIRRPVRLLPNRLDYCGHLLISVKVKK